MAKTRHLTIYLCIYRSCALYCIIFAFLRILTQKIFEDDALFSKLGLVGVLLINAITYLSTYWSANSKAFLLFDPVDNCL